MTWPGSIRIRGNSGFVERVGALPVPGGHVRVPPERPLERHVTRRRSGRRGRRDLHGRQDRGRRDGGFAAKEQRARDDGDGGLVHGGEHRDSIGAARRRGGLFSASAPCAPGRGSELQVISASSPSTVTRPHTSRKRITTGGMPSGAASSSSFAGGGTDGGGVDADARRSGQRPGHVRGRHDLGQLLRAGIDGYEAGRRRAQGGRAGGRSPAAGPAAWGASARGAAEAAWPAGGPRPDAAAARPGGARRWGWR